MSDSKIKQIIGITAVFLTFAAYIPYYRDVLRKKTHPHLYSWALWGLLSILIVALQIKGDAGPATLVTAAAGLLCFGIVILSIRNGKKDITIFDSAIACLGLVAIGFWLIVHQPLISAILVIMADLLAFAPTVRKSWYKPHSETLSLYITNTFRFALAVLAVRSYSILSVAWPAIWVVINALFSVMLVVRRSQLDKD